MVGVGKTRLVVQYDDPKLGSEEEDVPSLIRNWGECGNVLTRLRIDGRPPQKELEDFPRDLRASQ